MPTMMRGVWEPQAVLVRLSALRVSAKRGAEPSRIISTAILTLLLVTFPLRDAGRGDDAPVISFRSVY